MRLLFASDTFPPDVNGCSYATGRLVLQLLARGHELLVVAPAPDDGAGERQEGDLRTYRLRSQRLPFFKGFRISLLPNAAEVARVVAGFRPDVVHVSSHFYTCRAVARAAQASRIPVVGTNHFMPENLVHYLHLPEFLEARVRKAAWGEFTRVFSKLDAVTTPTATAAAVLPRIGFQREVRVISNGIDLRRFTPLEPHGAAAHEPSTVLSVGRVDREKNLDVAIRAVALLRDRGLPGRLVVAGRGEHEGALRFLARSLSLGEERVRFAGFVPDAALPDLYRSAACFVMAGCVELQSLVTMEAMASGLPIVAADALALPELCHDGENGRLVRPGDSTALANALADVLSNPARRQVMGEESLRIIRAHDIDRSAAQYEELYASLAPRGSAR